MKISQNNRALSIAAVFAAMIASPAHATFSWTFTSDTNPDQGNCGPAAPGNTCTQSSTVGSQTIGLTASGWASTSSATTGGTNKFNSALQTATLNMWDGLAVQSSASNETQVPQHATDNSGRLESILFEFNDAIALTNVIMGWHQDSDFSLFRYIGTDSNPALNTKTYGTDNGALTKLTNNSTNKGWDLVGNYDYAYSNQNVDTDISFTVNPTQLTSRFWLVTARFNTGGAAPDSTNDYFKVKTLKAEAPEETGRVPEPSTLALITIAFAGLTSRYRKITTA